MNLAGSFVRESMHLQPNVITSRRNPPQLRILVQVHNVIHHTKSSNHPFQPSKRFVIGMPHKLSIHPRLFPLPGLIKLDIPA